MSYEDSLLQTKDTMATVAWQPLNETPSPSEHGITGKRDTRQKRGRVQIYNVNMDSCSHID